MINVAEEEEEEEDFFAIVGRDGPVLIWLTCGRCFHLGIVLTKRFHQSAQMLDTSVWFPRVFKGRRILANE